MSEQLRDETEQPPIEQVIAGLRDLADEAEKNVDQRKSKTDLSDVDPAQMAVAEAQGMMKAYQQAWQLAISKRNEVLDDDQPYNPEGQRR